ncbi:hypothetical protein EMGBS4_16150 [Acidimicrobiaceae bacterium]|nr:hypothetical protein EMGBS4_16150 [Acidimicrobiaceae bacterium]
MQYSVTESKISSKPMNQKRNLFCGICLVAFSSAMSLLSVLWTPYDPLEINPDYHWLNPRGRTVGHRCTRS